MPIAVIVNGSKFAVHADHLNTPRRLTNEQGQAVWQWAYSAFGDEGPTLAANRFARDGEGAGTTNIPPITYNLRYPGQYADAESGLHYNYFRSYDPSGGGYTQPDPIGLAGGWNQYRYVDNNPLNWIDPEGLQAEHTKKARPSTEQKHQEAEARRKRDAGGEKGDQRRRPPSKRPPGYKGPWPIVPGFLPLICPLCPLVMPEPTVAPEACQ
ncbi:RHS repeat domain-containing protein [Ramlibacter sp. Leaf400]|uniref:RHS repeat domain-containing protein n=1 Tax=Ramlibacter sp. Leaf400 TaxID=1736365 RepID=UPI003FA747A7